MGHRNIATTQRYTHLRPVHEIPAHERLAEAVPIADLVTVPRKRASGKPVGNNDGTLRQLILTYRHYPKAAVRESEEIVKV